MKLLKLINLILVKQAFKFFYYVVTKKKFKHEKKNRFSKKVNKNLYLLSKPLLSLEKFWSFGGA